jgi:hypothetical protein
MNQLFGVTHQLDVGLVNPVKDERVELTFTRDFGGLARGTSLSFSVAGNEHVRAYLPVVPSTAEVIARDQHGRPALLRRQAGRGSLILCAYPLEYFAGATALANPDALVTLYGALATHAGVRRPVSVDDPAVACDVLVHADGTRYAVLTSHAPEPLTVKAVFCANGEPARPLGLVPLGESKATDRVEVPSFGVGIFKIAES